MHVKKKKTKLLNVLGCSFLVFSCVFLTSTSLSLELLLFFMEGKDVTEEMSAPWKETTLQTLLSNYEMCNIYNVHEFGHVAIKSLKSKYRTKIVQKMIDAIGNDKSLLTISITEIMKMLIHAWDNVSTTTVQSCFKKAGFLMWKKIATPTIHFLP